MNKFDKINLGDKAEIKHKITQVDIDRFVELTGDDNRIHVDSDYAKKTVFKKPVAHGMLGASFISTIIGTKIPGDGALWFSQNLEFLLPVRIGDELLIEAEVLKKNPTNNTIELSTNVLNQNKQVVIKGVAKVKIVEHEEESYQKKNLEEVKKCRTALIIGATGGIGSEISLELASKKYNLILCYNSNHEKASDLLKKCKKNKIKAISIKANINNKNDIDNIFEKAKRYFNSIDTLINCATSPVRNIDIHDLDFNDISEQININIKSNIQVVKKLLPYMKKNNFGKIVFLTTQYTEGAPPTSLLPYVTAKYALNGFAKALAIDLAKFNIHVNLVSPGMTETNLISDLPKKAKMLVSAKSPIKRLAHPNDVASAISFLVSNDSNYITGETIRVNGGQIMI
jgi:3-oxoacyl-[acyl-carrier protein] reductase